MFEFEIECGLFYDSCIGLWLIVVLDYG